MKFLLVLLAFVAVIQAFVPRVQQRPGSLKLAAAKEESNILGKADLLDILKDATGVSKKDVETVLTAFQAAVREQVLEGGKEIRLRDFGTFKRKESVARVGRNPRTGEELQISGSKSVSFSVSQAMKIKDTPSKAKPAPKK